MQNICQIAEFFFFFFANQKRSIPINARRNLVHVLQRTQIHSYFFQSKFLAYFIIFLICCTVIFYFFPIYFY